MKSCLAAIRATKAVKGLAHITGGGFPDNIPRVLPKGLARASILRACRCCRCSNGWRSEGGIAQNEMLRTFNCGIGMIVIAAPKDAAAVAQAFTQRRRDRRSRIGERRARVGRSARRL